LNMYKWLENVKSSKVKKPMPVLSFPGTQLINVGVDRLVRDGVLQARCMKAIADRYDTLASVSLMDLSVEAQAFGSPVRFSPDEVPTVSARILETEEDIQALHVPQVGAGRTGEYVKTISEAKKLITDRPVFAGHIGPFSLSGRLLDMNEIMVMSMTEPELVEEVLEKATQFLLSYVKAFKQAGADGVVIAEPAAGLLSPALNARMSMPYIRRIVESVQDESFIVVYHNCGNTLPLIQDILKIGARMLHFGNAIDIEKMLPQVPSNIVVMGNVDPSSQFRNGTPESITARVNELLEHCSKYPNYVISSGCDVPPLSPLSNIDAFFKAVKDFYSR
jgi:uroporphyrinogen decarboxylase